MHKKFKKKVTVKYGNKVLTTEVSVFGGEHTDYSGFGPHKSDKDASAQRRHRKLEERKAKRGDWD